MTPPRLAQNNAYRFVQAYVPFFRYFFLVKPYPTKGEKEWLAKKAGMGFRQVHVWVRLNILTAPLYSDESSRSFKTTAIG